MTTYPNGVYDPRTKENEADVVYDEDKSVIAYAEDVSFLDDEVVAIETELGENPKGDHADVTARLDYQEFFRATTRIINTDSPYNILATDHVIFADTNGGAITINLPAGIDGRHYKIINVGSSGNDITLVPDGSDKIFGVNANQTLHDAEIFNLDFETIEGWW